MADFKKKLNTVKLVNECVKLKISGLGNQEIADNLNISTKLVKLYLSEALTQVSEELFSNVKTLIAEQALLLNEMKRGIYQEATTGDYDAIDKMLKILDREAKLLQLDRPIQQETMLSITSQNIVTRQALESLPMEALDAIIGKGPEDPEGS